MTKTVLYVDDDLDDQELFTLVLNEYYPNMKCLLARDGIEALKVLSTEDLPDYIFIDVNMPRMDGYELLTELQSKPNYASARIYILSTSILPEFIGKFINKGASACFIKPTLTTEFARIFDRCFDADNELPHKLKSGTIS